MRDDDESASDGTPAATLKQMAKKARHEAYLAEKERLRTDPVEIAAREKLKRERHEATKAERDKRKAESGAAKAALRAAKDAALRAALLPASAAPLKSRKRAPEPTE